MPDYQVIRRSEFTGEITLEPPSIPQLLSGTEALVQVVYLAIMNSPGRSVNYPDHGSGMPELIGKTNILSEGEGRITAVLNSAVSKIKGEIMENQSTIVGLDPAERLVDLEVVDVKEGVSLGEVKMIIQLTNGTDETVRITL